MSMCRLAFLVCMCFVRDASGLLEIRACVFCLLLLPVACGQDPLKVLLSKWQLLDPVRVTKMMGMVTGDR